jgi:hypothetical protein
LNVRCVASAAVSFVRKVGIRVVIPNWVLSSPTVNI